METATNQNIFQIDWSRGDRQKFLSEIQCSKKSRKGFLSVDIPANNVCGVDVAEMDGRSVKASLEGRGDLRVFWWKLNVAAHWIVFPRASLESIMYALDLRHYVLATGWLQTKSDFSILHKEIVKNGAIAGIGNFLRKGRPQI
jgi:hypothetical protein